MGYSTVLVTARPHLSLPQCNFSHYPAACCITLHIPSCKIQRSGQKTQHETSSTFFCYLFCLRQNVPLSTLCSNSVSLCYSLRASPFSYLNEVPFSCIEISFMEFRQFYLLVLLEWSAASMEVCTR
jgi:hypothetical protein